MTDSEFRGIAKRCNQFLMGHHPRSVRERIQGIADSAYAELESDTYGRGGFLAEFEREIAELLGKEAAVFMPSGTMAQPIALRIWSDRAQNRSIAFHPTCHLELHEQMGYRELHHLEATLLGESDRLFRLEDLRAVKRPLSSLLIELPQREIGGQLPTWEELNSIIDYARETGAKVHLDGARLWECQPYYGRPYSEIVAGFDSAYVSFYKVFRGLPGAALVGPADFIEEARIWMRRQGGNLFQMFPNAISAKIGMDAKLAKIPAYVARASEVAAVLADLPGISVVPERPPTNMMHVYFDAPAERVLDAAGRIAEREKCLLLSWASETPRGTKFELWIGDAGLEIPLERIQALLTEFAQMIAAD